MRMKLIVGLVLAVVGLLGILTSVYAWNMTSEARDIVKENNDALIEHYKGGGSELDALEMEKARDDAELDEETNQRTAGVSSAVGAILAILGAILIVVDVMKVKIPGESEEEGGSKEQAAPEEEKEDAEEE